jgi:6-phosphofructo-2-kinase/fructose-2,6-biphosphatase 2
MFFSKPKYMVNTVYLSRHGQSVYNTEDRIGGNSDLSKYGSTYPKMLLEFMEENEDIDLLKIYTSQLKRTKQTVSLFSNTKIELELLNEINAGDFEDMTYDDIKEKNREEFEKRKLDKFNYQYPNGESYKDLQSRVIGIMKHLHQDFKNDQVSLIVCHNAVLRIIYSILMDIPNDEIPYIEIPLHTVFKFELVNNSYKVSIFDLD